MTQLSLPPVAKSFYTFCKKCDADRYHLVLTHTSSTSAKIECEVCKSRKTYSLPKAGSSTASSARKSATGSGHAKAAGSARSHTGQYTLMMDNQSDKPSTQYSIKAKFSENQKISHPKFGIGFVIKTFSDKVEVVFQDEVKTLMHNRS